MSLVAFIVSFFGVDMKKKSVTFADDVNEKEVALDETPAV